MKTKTLHSAMMINALAIGLVCIVGVSKACQDPSNCKITVWVSGVQNADHSPVHPVNPEGFYHDPVYGVDGWDDYIAYYRNSGELETDPNFISHFMELQQHREDPERTPYVYMCHARRDESSGEPDITGRFIQTSWRWDNPGPKPQELWTHDKSVWRERLYGGISQRHDISMPPDEQCYYLGTVYVYICPTWADFTEDWGYSDCPWYDFNDNGVVDLEDMQTYIREILYWGL